MCKLDRILFEFEHFIVKSVERKRDTDAYEKYPDSESVLALKDSARLASEAVDKLRADCARIEATMLS